MDTGKIGPQYRALTLAVAPRIAGRYFSIAVSLEVPPVIGADV